MSTAPSNSPTMRHALIFDAPVEVFTYGGDEVTVVAERHAPVTVNRMPLEFRIHFRRTEHGHWQGTNFFIYRVEADRPHRYQQRPATDNQSQKLYHEIKEICETLPESFLLAGAYRSANDKVTRANDKVAESEQALSDSMRARRSAQVEYDAALAAEQGESA